MSINLIWGYLGENILDRLNVDLKENGSDTIQIDPTQENIPDVNGASINLLTSNHFTRTKNDLRRLFSEFPMKHDFYEISSKIKFSSRFFFVHDHSEPFVLDETSALRYFSAVVTPWPTLHNGVRGIKLFSCDIAFKNQRDFDNYIVKRRAVWFVSNIKFNLQRFGVEGFSNEILRVIQGCDIAVKLPAYGEVTELIAKNLVESGVEVIPSSVTSERVILETETIVTSSYSGVGALAKYYHRDLIIVKNTHPSDFNPSCNLIRDYSFWLSNPPIIENNVQMLAALKRYKKPTFTRHRCGVFREDFIENYWRELFHS